MFGIKYETWYEICQMYFNIKTGTKKAYLQWFPFSKLSQPEQSYISGEEFFNKYIKSGAFVMFDATMNTTENFIQKSDGSFRDSSLISPILYLVFQAVGKEISKIYKSRRPDEIEVYYAGNYDNLRPLYKQDYDAFFKSINSGIENYQYFIKTDISNFFSSINIDKLIYRIDAICNEKVSNIPQCYLRMFKELLTYCGEGRFPLIENSVASSYLATIVYLDIIDCKIHRYISNNISVFTNFRILRYVDDMYILIASDRPLGYLHEAYNEIRNEYSSILKEYGLALNSKKCCIRETHEINEELQKSLYDEYFNGQKCEIERLFSGRLLSFINDISNELLFDSITVEKYNEIICNNFSLPDIEFMPNEVFNYFIYENEDELQSNDVVKAITDLVNQDVSFISLDPKRLTVMIMKTHNDNAIKAFLNHLFIKNRSNKWNSYDTTIAITYLIQSKFRHIDLLRILNEKCPELYFYYYYFCKVSFCNSWKDKMTEKYIYIINDDSKCFALYFMYLVERQKNNSLAMFAYFKNFFDRMTAHLAFVTGYESGKKINYKGFYKENQIKKFYSHITDGEDIIERAHKLRNENPLAHASANLIDKDSTSKDISNSISDLKSLLDKFCDEIQ